MLTTGAPEGAADGALVGKTDGFPVGITVGVDDGTIVVGEIVDGGSDGGDVITTIGALVAGRGATGDGFPTPNDGAFVAVFVVGAGTTTETGELVGAATACGDRCIVFFSVGYAVGNTVGSSVGDTVGKRVGEGVTGAAVGELVSFAMF